MSGQGYHLAISTEQANKLIRSENDFEVAENVNTLLEHLEHLEPANVLGYYKEWDVLHRCLSDGTFNPKGGDYPLNQCFLGGQLLVTEGLIVNLVKPGGVSDAASALAGIEKQWFTARFMRLFAKDYSTPISDEECTLYYQRLQELSQFYSRAASERKAIVFYTDDSLADLLDSAERS